MSYLSIVAIISTLGALCYGLAWRTRPPQSMPKDPTFAPQTFEFPTTFVQTEELIRELPEKALYPYRLVYTSPRFLVFEKRPSLKSFGYYLCLYLSPNERGGTRLDIAIADRLVATGSDSHFLNEFTQALTRTLRAEIQSRYPAAAAFNEKSSAGS